MVFQVGPDGEVFDGPAPSGESTVVLTLVGGQLQEVLLPRPVVTGGDSSVVEVEALRYDALERVPALAESVAPRISVAEAVPALTEEVVAALLARADEAAPTPVETIRTTVGATALDGVPSPADVEAVVLGPTEIVPLGADAATLLAVTSEALPLLTEVAIASVRPTATEAVPTIVDSTAAAILVTPEALVRPAETSTINLTLTPYAASVVSNTNWTNPTNALGNTTGTAATLTATSSGLAGTTSNTVTGTLVLGYAAATPTDLTIDAVSLSIEYSQTNSGALLGQSSTRSMEYSLDGGTTWTVAIAGASAQAKTIGQVDITAAVGGDWSKISAFRFRYVGSNTSGTGLGATNTNSLFRAWLTIAASKGY